MSHTNSTTNYNLPQFLTTDKPAWLTDVNNAYSAIDTAIKAAKDAGDNAQEDATQAISDASDASTAAAAADAKGAGAVASISDTFDATSTYSIGEHVMYNNLLYVCTVAVTTPGAWTGSANWNRVTIETLVNEVKTVSDANAASIVNLENTSVSIVRGPGISDTVPTPTVKRRGHSVMLHLSIELPALVYTSTNIWTISDPPSATIEFFASLGGNPTLVRIDTQGHIYFPTGVTLSTPTWILGGFTYLD